MCKVKNSFAIYVYLCLKFKKYMDYTELIERYCGENKKLKDILLTHSRMVAQKALQIAKNHPELGADSQFIEEAAMLHDIGIIRTDAPGIFCYGTEPYICHGTIGAEILRNEGYPRHALVCERHTGAGLSLKEIEEQHLPVPHRDLMPVSIEEQIICFADKFFSKTRPEKEKTVEQAYKSLVKFGDEGAKRFKIWCDLFL